MKTSVLIFLFGAAALLLGACQNTPPSSTFPEKTHRTYNPQTGTFEQSPPWGKQGNKSDDNGVQ
jgi:outer membrane biogenesis lipoprotein LolB